MQGAPPGSPQREGRPRIPIDWDRVQYLALIGMSKPQIAAIFLCDEDTLERYCQQKCGWSFAQMWERKRMEGQAAIAAAIHSVGTHAPGTDKTTMPQVTASIYLSKVRNQWWDRQVITGADGGPIRFAFADVGDPGRLVEGTATEVPALPLGEPDSPPE